MMSCGSRVSHHHHYSLGFGLGLGFRNTCGIVRLSNSMPNPQVSAFRSTVTQKLRGKTDFSTSSLRSQSTGDIPTLSDCFSQGEDEHELTYDGLSSVAGGIVALGKFDALHVGHRELAIQASKVGTPYLLSFAGMAEVLGWEPRAPIVAKCDRRRVLSSWAPCCGNTAPAEVQVEFSTVRHLTARQFVEKLSKELGVHGVVAGENYRFGYKAAGDASDLVRLCKEFGIGAYIINSVMDKKNNMPNIESSNSKERGQVSSTRVRHALAIGDMSYVSELLGRPHRLVLMVKDHKVFLGINQNRVSVPKSCLLNLPPKGGLYENCSLFIDNEYKMTCRLLIDTTHVHLEMDELDPCIDDSPQELPVLGIEFGHLRY